MRDPRQWGLVLMVTMAAPAAHGATPTTAVAPAAVERRLHVAAAEASSFLVNDWNQFQENYLPLYVGDDDATTAWTEGAAGDGTGQWLRLKVTPVAGATKVRLRVRNGYQKTAKLFAANARARAIKVVLSPGGATTDVELTDKIDWQELTVTQPAGPLDGVELRIASVYPGTKYDDLCISDVQVLVTATTPDNPAFEKARFDKLLKWKSDRRAAAKLLKSSVAKTLPFAPAYHRSPTAFGNATARDTRETCLPHDQLCAVAEQLRFTRKAAGSTAVDIGALDRALATVKQAGDFAPVQLVARDKRAVPALDGLCTATLSSCEEGVCYGAIALPQPGQVGFMSTAQLSALDIKDAPSLADIENAVPKDCNHRDKTKTWAFAPPLPSTTGGRTPPNAILLASCGKLEYREGYSNETTVQLLAYGASGQLEVIAGPGYTSVLHWRTGTSGPVLAGGLVSNGDEVSTLDEATSLAAQ